MNLLTKLDKRNMLTLTSQELKQVIVQDQKFRILTRKKATASYARKSKKSKVQKV